MAKKHPELPVMFFSEGEGKATALACVPQSLVGKMPAGAWLNDALAVMGGKGGGRPTSAQGMAPEPASMPAAMQVAEEFAQMKL